ncbi:MAG: 50S ribosomal protein L25 [Ignavibacteriae bacterium]|nr:50S ribosomal protein L25 [Ignavibacteriota bacterium]
MSELALTAEVRKEFGKRTKQLRAQGKVPGIYYGHGQANIPVVINELALRPLIRTTATHVINLKLDDGSTRSCILRDVDYDPVTDKPIHVDFFGLKEDEAVTIQVPIVIKGTAQGVKDGGILQHIMHYVRVSCLPKFIPDHLEVDVTNLLMNRSVHVKDLTLENVKILENENSTVVAVVPPTILKEAEAAPAAEGALPAAPAEPEVIAKGKKPEEGAEGEAEKPAAEKKAPEKAEKKAEKK